MDSSAEESTDIVKIMTRRDLYDLMQECPERDIVKKWILWKITCLLTLEQCENLKQKISHFKHQCKTRWMSVARKKYRFIKANENWLNSTFIEIPVSSRPGRPSKSFEESSERSKRRKTEELRKHESAEKLTYAAQMSLRASGKVDASNVVEDITSTPRRASKYRKAYTSNMQDRPQLLSPTQALSIFVEADLSRRQYDIIRGANKSLYPSYKIIQKAKKDCYPKQEAYRVTATHAEINLQALLDCTALRLVTHIDEVLATLTSEEKNNLQLISKWGCDGSNQAQYKQKFENCSESDANIFQSSFVPLRLISTVDSSEKIIWQNPTPSSPRYCRPIRIRFIHESTDVTKDEIKYIKDKINTLQNTTSSNGDGDISIKHTN